MNFVRWEREKNPETKKRKTRKNSPFGRPPISTSTKLRPTVFRCPKTPKTSRTYPRWERDPSLIGQKIQGYALYGQLMTDDMNYIHVKFQDLQKKADWSEGCGTKLLGMEKILETSN